MRMDVPVLTKGLICVVYRGVKPSMLGASSSVRPSTASGSTSTATPSISGSKNDSAEVSWASAPGRKSRQRSRASARFAYGMGKILSNEK